MCEREIMIEDRRRVGIEGFFAKRKKKRGKDNGELSLE